MIRSTEKVPFVGPPGVGKIHLAVALGVKAVKSAFSTQHYVLDDLTHLLKGEGAVPPHRLRSKRYVNSPLLVSDDVGLGRWAATSPTSSSGS